MARFALPFALCALAFATGLVLGQRPAFQGMALPGVGASDSWGSHSPRHAGPGREGQPLYGKLRTNVYAPFNTTIESPKVHETAYVDPKANVGGHVYVGERVFVAPFASIRGDEGQPLHIGRHSNVQDGVVVHALATEHYGAHVSEHAYEVEGQRWAVHVGERVSLAHQAQVHGPAWIEDDVFIGMQALVFNAHIGEGSVVEPAARVIGVFVPRGRYVPAGRVVATQRDADELPAITYSYGFSDLNREVVKVNVALADGYAGRAVPAASSPPSQ